MMLNFIWFIPLLPLAAAVLNLVLGRKFGDPRSGWVATIATGSSFLLTVLVYLEMLGLEAEQRSHVEVLFSWVPVGNLQVDFALLADPLSVTMALFVTGISTL
ncbi:MAG: NADH-quinone oxidoreductase subunit L, partial [Actinobacteria bacterium]|nr:NADH-quinone oxidoreductase subunit L [Actinomycetota bacterium]